MERQGCRHSNLHASSASSIPDRRSAWRITWATSTTTCWWTRHTFPTLRRVPLQLPPLHLHLRPPLQLLHRVHLPPPEATRAASPALVMARACRRLEDLRADRPLLSSAANMQHLRPQQPRTKRRQANRRLRQLNRRAVQRMSRLLSRPVTALRPASCRPSSPSKLPQAAANLARPHRRPVRVVEARMIRLQLQHQWLVQRALHPPSFPTCLPQRAVLLLLHP